MSTVPHDDLTPYRALAQSLARRLQEDPALRLRVEEDPMAVLGGEGLPEALVPLFLRETDLAGDVIGYMDELANGCLVSHI